MTDKNFTDEEKVIALLKISDDIHANANLIPEEAKVLLSLIEAKAAVRAEAIKEFAERLKPLLYGYYDSDIDALAKELTEDQK